MTLTLCYSTFCWSILTTLILSIVPCFTVFLLLYRDVSSHLFLPIFTATDSLLKPPLTWTVHPLTGPVYKHVFLLCRKKGEIELGELLLAAHHAVPLSMVLSDLASTVRVAPYITEDSTALVSRDEEIKNSSSSKETAVAEVVAQPSVVTGKVPLFCKISTCFADFVRLYSQSHSFLPVLKVKCFG